jgi:hypothetical protein
MADLKLGSTIFLAQITNCKQSSHTTRLTNYMYNTGVWKLKTGTLTPKGKKSIDSTFSQINFWVQPWDVELGITEWKVAERQNVEYDNIEHFGQNDKIALYVPYIFLPYVRSAISAISVYFQYFLCSETSFKCILFISKTALIITVLINRYLFWIT